jgi:hypothetical protein
MPFKIHTVGGGLRKCIADFADCSGGGDDEAAVRALAVDLNAQGFTVDIEADLDVIGKQMSEIVKTGASIPERSREKVLAVLNELTDKHFPADMEDKKTGRDKLMEIMKSIGEVGGGAEREFEDIHHQLEKIVNDIVNYQEAMNIAQVRIVSSLENCKPDERAAVENNIALMKLVMDETAGKVAQLQELLGTTLTATQKEMIALKNVDAKTMHLIGLLKEDPNKFGSAIASALKSMGATGYKVAVVKKALDKVHLTASQFKDAASTSELNKKILENMDKIKDAKEFAEFWTAAAKLFGLFGDRAEIVAALDGTTGRHEKADNIYGGNTDYEVVEKKIKTPMEKKVEQLKLQQTAILSAFNREMSTIVNNMYNAIQVLAKKSASEQVPITAPLEGFVRSLVVLKEFQNKNVYYALSGLANDQSGRNLKDQIVGDVKNMNKFIEEMIAMKEYAGVAEYLRALKTTFDSLLLLIGQFMDKVGQIWGGKDRTEGGDAVEGAGVAELEKFNIPEFTRSRVELGRVIQEFLYFFNVAQTKRNFAATAKELESYGVDYERTLGVSIAQLKEKRDDTLAMAISPFRDDKPPAVGAAFYAPPRVGGAAVAAESYWPVVVGGINPSDAEKNSAKKLRAEARRVLEEQAKGVDEFYRVVQAIDLYAQAYTKAAVADSNAIKDLKLQISDVEFIAKFYNDLSGEKLGNVFEMFQSARAPTPYTAPNYRREIEALTSGHLIGNNEAAIAAIFDDIYTRYLVIENNPGITRANKDVDIAALLGNGGGHTLEHDLNAQFLLGNVARAALVPVGSNARAVYDAVAVALGGVAVAKAAATTGLTPAQQAIGNAAITAFDAYIAAIANAPAGTKLIDKMLIGSRALDASTADVPTRVIAGLLFTLNTVVGLDAQEYAELKTTIKTFGIAARKAIGATLAPNTVPVLPTDFDPDTSKHYYQRLAGLFNRNGVGAPTLPGDPDNELDLFGPMTSRDYKDSNYNKLYETIKSALSDNAILKNIVNIFVSIGNKFGGKNIESFMTPVQIYNGLMDFIIKSAIVVKADNPPVSLSMANVDSTVVGLDKLNEEMQIFSMVIKTMISKVFVSIGLYDLLERPGEIPSLSPVRMILGGDDDYPKIEDGAVELYIRLPLLAEYYRDLFSIDGPVDQATNQKIAMLPELEGTFSKLIKMIFKTTKYINVGTYSDPDVREMILIINEIYSKFASDENPVMAAVFAFIGEINRRYGLMKQSDVTAYNELYKRQNLSNNVYNTELSEYAILPGEEDIQYNKLAPSEMYSAGKPKKINWKGDDKITKDYRNLFRKFRTQIDNIFDMQQKIYERSNGSTDALTSGINQYSFKELITQAKSALKKATKDSGRYEVAARLIQDVSAFTKVDHFVGVMFHETVVTGVNVLMGVYQFLANFRHLIMTLNPAQIVRQMLANVKDNKSTLYADLLAQYPDMIVLGGAVGNLTIDANGAFGAALPAVLAAIPAGFVGVSGAFVAGNAKPTDEAVIKAVLEYFVDVRFNKVNAFKRFMETMLAHAGDLQGMVEIKFSDTNMYVDYSVLIAEVTSLFDATRMYYNKFRNYLTKDQRDLYEDATRSGSIAFLEENLMEDLIRGSKMLGSDRPMPNLIKLNEYVSETFKELVTKKQIAEHDATGAVVGGPNPVTGGAGRELFDYPDHTTYYTAAVFTSQVGAGGSGGGGIVPYTFNNTSIAAKMLETRDSKNKVVYLRHMGGYNYVFSETDQIDIVNGATAAEDNHRGAIMLFNNLIFALLKTCFDETTRHVYAPIINGLLNSSLNSNIMGNTVIPDLTAGVDGGGANAVPIFDNQVSELVFPFAAGVTTGILPTIANYPAGAVLFAVVGAIIRNLTTGFSNSNVVKIATESLADISMFVRERMKANLPVFEKMFELLSIRCKIFRTTIEKGVHIADKQKVDNVFQSVFTASQTVVKIIRQVISDMNDSPKFMEFSQDFIADYEAANEQKPLALLSSLLLPLRNDNLGANGEAREFLPVSQYGQPQFKYLYGTRAALRSTVKADPSMVSGFNDLVSLYNAMTNPVYAIDTGKMNDFILPTLKLARYLVDAKQYKGFLSQLYRGTAGAASTVVFTRLNLNTENYAAGATEFNSFAVSVPVADGSIYKYTQGQIGPVNADLTLSRKGIVKWNMLANNTNVGQLTKQSEFVELVESKYQDERLKSISDYTMGNSSISAERKDIRIYNILDMNVIPINVHALQKDFPLANLYNYSYTYDKMICNLLEVNSTNGIMEDASGAAYDKFNQSEAHFMTRLMIKPYDKVTPDDYNTYMANVFRGYTDTEMGRPKYLSDQIYNKVLFGEVYRGPYEWNKRGPQANDRYISTLTYNEIYLGLFKWYMTNVFGGVNPGVGAIINALGTNDIELHLTPEERKAIMELATGIYNYGKQHPSGPFTTAAMNVAGSKINDQLAALEAARIEAQRAAVIGPPPITGYNLTRRPAAGNAGVMYTGVDSIVIYFTYLGGGRVPQTETYNTKNFHLSFLKSPVTTKVDGREKMQRADPYRDVEVVPLASSQYRVALNTLGKKRFDTYLIRSIVFLGQVHRLISYKIGKDLIAHSDIVIRGNSMVDPNVVDYALNRAYNARSHQTNTSHNSNERTTYLN